MLVSMTLRRRRRTVVFAKYVLCVARSPRLQSIVKTKVGRWETASCLQTHYHFHSNFFTPFREFSSQDSPTGIVMSQSHHLLSNDCVQNFDVLQLRVMWVMGCRKRFCSCAQIFEMFLCKNAAIKRPLAQTSEVKLTRER